ncbi:glycogenin [Aspergillus affinis]|uniref:glycogenin n=1 Tax=Aspergillus affinis TaxID=1070780 RepID=UPI0022FDF20C|nr:putative capsule-associated protein CAP1 [Aspergillus affinis]KAI9045713.1 putative capsule-associated protein CAP1 [Aspergillus affinis]
MSSEGSVAYCTLLLSDHYLPGAVVLAHSLRDTGTNAKLVVLYTPDSLQPATIQELRTIYDELIPVHPMTNSTPANLWLMERPDLIATFTKIELWRQTQFRRIVYIDCDVVALRAPDELLDLEVDFAAVPDVGWPDCFNSGLMVLRPNLEDYFALQALAERGISFDGADQGLLNLHFKDWHRLSFTYNCTPSANYQYIPAYKHFQSTINLIHFIGSRKPWNMPRQVDPADSPYNQLLGRWWSIYDRHYHPVASATSVPKYTPEYNYQPEGEPSPLQDDSATHQPDPPVEPSSSTAFEHIPSDQSFPSFQGPPTETQPVISSEPAWTQMPVPQPVSRQEDSTPHQAGYSEHHDPVTIEPPVDIPQAQIEEPQSNIDRNVQAPFFSAVPQYVRGEEHISAYIQPQPHGAPSVTHIEQRSWAQPDVGPPTSYPSSSGFIETQASDQPEEFVHREEEHSSERSTPRPETPTFEAPKAEWDAPHEPPPLNSKPEAIALELKTYTMSENNQLFQPPVAYPEAPKNMYYDVPETKPEPEKLTQIFPWESHMPKPTRVFVNDDQSTLPSPSSTRISTESSKEDSMTTPSLESTFTWTYSEPPESWENYTRSNAWDDVPEIQRYIQSIQQARKAKVQVISGASSSGQRISGQAIQEPGSDTRLTHFPSEIERPSLPVTPMPIRRRSSHFNTSEEEDYVTGQLPVAEGVPNQEDWNPLTHLEELQRRQSEVLENPDLLIERIAAAAAGSSPD